MDENKDTFEQRNKDLWKAWDDFINALLDAGLGKILIWCLDKMVYIMDYIHQRFHK